MSGDFPPNSRVTGRTSLADADRMAIPVGTEPVNVLEEKYRFNNMRRIYSRICLA